MDEITANVVTGTYLDLGAGKVIMKKFATHWQATQVGRDGTVRMIGNAIRLHLTPALGERSMASLRRSDIRGSSSSCQTHSPRGQSGTCTTCSTGFWPRQWMTASSAADLPVVKVRPGTALATTPLTADEQAALSREALKEAKRPVARR